MKVVVGASSFADGNTKVMELLQSKGVEVIKNPYKRRMTKSEIIEHLQGADGLLAGLEPLDEEVFSQCPELKAIARIGIGMDNVDKEAAQKYNIKISNTPEGPTNAVAEMVVSALLMCAHQILPANQDVHNGVWKKRLGFSIQGCKVLVVGYGHIGRRTSQILSQMGAEVKKYDKYQVSESDCTLEEGLSWADVITIHASGLDEIISWKEISLMKDGAVLLNSARGPLVNEDALYDALKTGKIAWFWGDALWQEPYQGKLCECGNAILTPHICTYTVSCREKMETEAANNILRDLGINC